MPYIEDLKAELQFEIKTLTPVKCFVHEAEVGAVFVGSIPACREYIQQRRSKQALKEEEKRGRNPMIDRFDRMYRNPKRDGVIQWPL